MIQKVYHTTQRKASSRYRIIAGILLSIIFLGISCDQDSTSEDRSLVYSISPAPKVLLKRSGYFNLDKDVRISADFSDEKQTNLVSYVINSLKNEIGHTLKVSDLYRTDSGLKTIKFELASDIDQASQSYELLVQANAIQISSSSYVGLMYGYQSLLQLIRLNKDEQKVLIPGVRIQDQPKYLNRAIMIIGTKASFNSSQQIGPLLEIMETLKLNHLILHNENSISNPGMDSLVMLANSKQIMLSRTRPDAQEPNELMIEPLTDSTISLPFINTSGHFKMYKN
mgnify:CR=1 FL=1